jgi:hypothetical protein
VCYLGPGQDKARLSTKPYPVVCPSCLGVFCLKCRAGWTAHVTEDNRGAVCPAPSFSLPDAAQQVRVDKGPRRYFWRKSKPKRTAVLVGGDEVKALRGAREAHQQATGYLALGIADPSSIAAVIKACPNCRVFIERDDGCAQMMCRRCNYIFCWFCLAPLDVSS